MGANTCKHRCLCLHHTVPSLYACHHMCLSLCCSCFFTQSVAVLCFSWTSDSACPGTWAWMTIAVAFSSCIDIYAIEMDMRKDLDTNHELQTGTLIHMHNAYPIVTGISMSLRPHVYSLHRCQLQCALIPTLILFPLRSRSHCGLILPLCSHYSHSHYALILTYKSTCIFTVRSLWQWDYPTSSQA